LLGLAKLSALFAKSTAPMSSISLANMWLNAA
jgi:hypothetical protein